ncbi:uncharacterized protein LOC113393371 [Vanessa tameamea]|uniref:Uncharacterized protein LOC113393371 n=1 Tax=Vanessa tameamea TaxID=334116 RepID=A0ABM4ALB1_VANTA
MPFTTNGPEPKTQMEMSKREYNLRPLPGVRRGASGADAGCYSMRTIGGEELSRRALINTNVTADRCELNRRTHNVEATADSLGNETNTPSTRPQHMTQAEREKDSDMLNEIISASPSPFNSYESPSSSPLSYQVSSRSNIISPMSVDVVQEAHAIEPTSATGTNRARKRWSDDMNKFIWRTYLIATKLNTSKIYLAHLHHEFSLKFPQMEASRQRLGDQCRAIVRNKLLPQEILEQIKQEVTESLQQTNNQDRTQNTQTNLSMQIHNSHQQGIRQRRRWTTEYNETIIRNYYKITELEENRSAYRQPLHQAVIAEHPELSEVSEQRISDQLRVILNNKMISDQKLKEIREEISNDLRLRRNHLENTSQHLTIPQNAAPAENNNHPHISPQTQPILDISAIAEQDQTTYYLDVEKIKKQYNITLEKFQNTNPISRPYIPKQNSSRKLAQIINVINTKILPQHISVEQDFVTTHTLIYCAAYTAATCNGTNIKDITSQPCQLQKRVPAWQKRLQKKIQDLRRDIGRLTEHINGNKTNRLTLLVEAIKNKYKIHSQHEEPNSSNEHFLDTLKQKLNAASSRLKRYLNCTLRKSQNTQFSNNEKKFYRILSSATQRNTSTNTQDITPPPANAIHTFWSSIWSDPVCHNTDAAWLVTDHEVINSIEPMNFEHISVEVFMRVLNKAHNWKSPGSDHIHNYWYKKFTSTHSLLHKHMNNFIQTPNLMPHFVTQGLTFMIPKDTDQQNPAKYRPITCLQTIYKILTGCITELLHEHIAVNNILAEEQKGCRKGRQGCKEQLVIDSVTMKHAISKKKNINTMYIDYRKAFDSIPHSWLLYVLQHYKIHPQLIYFLENSMQNWKTTLKITGHANTETPDILIRRGIFQGDALSPLWFCLALNPLSNMLQKSNLGYIITTPHKDTTLTHLMYMDDIKLYSDTIQSLHHLADITQTFSRDIHMEFGIDKCKTFSVKNGKIVPNSYILESGNIIEPLEEEATYKYLGFQQARNINQKETKNSLKTKFKHRLNILFRSQLNSHNLFKAINSYAIPVLTYSFGIINWSQCELHNLQRMINTTLTAHRKHHPRSCVQRMTLPRGEGGRGLIDIVNLHNKQITSLRHYFHQRSVYSPLHETVTLADKRFTPLNLKDRHPQKNERITDLNEKTALWRQKSLHGRHHHDLQQLYVDKAASNAWLRRGELFPETEAFMLAIQDQVIDTRNYQKHIIRTSNLQSDTCRHCHSNPETIQHITSACRALAQTDYKHRHDQVSAIIHQHLAHKYNFIDKKIPYYKYKPDTILENNRYRIYWDRTIITDKTIHFNRPDITLHDKIKKNVYLIDIAIPNTHNIQSTISEKLSKYQDLAIELKRQWRADTIHIVPIVISSTGVVPKSLQRSLDILHIPHHTNHLLQKAVILNTCRLTRKFLTTSSISTAIT